MLAEQVQPYPSHDRTVMAQLGLAVFGNGAAFVLLQFATAAILVLAANTAYNGFPGLSSIIAKDGYLPRQLANRGDRLVFSNGIFVLAGAAAGLLVAFGGITNALIPLYAVGVFTSFTLSQTGMVRHHLRRNEPGRRRNVVINAVGGDRHAGRVAHRRDHEVLERGVDPDRRDPGDRPALQGHPPSLPARSESRSNVPFDYRAPRRRHAVIVLVEEFHVGTLEAVAYARVDGTGTPRCA